MDATYKVPYTKIVKIEPHTGAERLELAFVYGFQVIVPKDKYKVGDSIVYIPIDSILPNTVECLLFTPDAKIKLHHNRVRQIKLRGLVSQGMIADPETLKTILNFAYIKDEQDVSEMLGITKYEPPIKGSATTQPKLGSRKQLAHPDFHSYNGLTNLKWMPALFEGKEVVIQCKLHGTNARAAKLPFRANTLLKKVKKLLGLAPKFEDLYGSNNVDISNSRGYKGFYGEDIYGKAFQDVDAFSKIKSGEIIYGEIIGPGIQKGYSYGLKEPRFILFDVKVMQADGSFKWMNPEDVENYAKERGFEFVPVLYKGRFNLELAKSMSTGPSVYYPEEPVREGCVVKDRFNYDNEGNKTALKLINEAYLADQSNTDEH